MRQMGFIMVSQNALKVSNRAGYIFLIFALTLLPVLLGPSVLVDKTWFRTLSFPEMTPTGKFWEFSYLISHVLVAYHVATEKRLLNNNKIYYLWWLQFALTWLFVFTFFWAQQVNQGGMVQYALAGTFLVGMFLTKAPWYVGVISLLPAAAFYTFGGTMMIMATG